MTVVLSLVLGQVYHDFNNTFGLPSITAGVDGSGSDRSIIFDSHIIFLCRRDTLCTRLSCRVVGGGECLAGVSLRVWP